MPGTSFSAGNDPGSLRAGKSAIGPAQRAEQGRVEWAVAWPLWSDGSYSYYCNTIPTPDGGTHEAGLRAAILKGLRGFGELIGNKKAVKQFLPELIAWQNAHGRPFELSTEASLNLADDDALLTMMQQAGFFVVFIGIESPDPDVLNVPGGHGVQVPPVSPPPTPAWLNVPAGQENAVNAQLVASSSDPPALKVPAVHACGHPVKGARFQLAWVLSKNDPAGHC